MEQFLKLLEEYFSNNLFIKNSFKNVQRRPYVKFSTIKGCGGIDEISIFLVRSLEFQPLDNEYIMLPLSTCFMRHNSN